MKLSGYVIIFVSLLTISAVALETPPPEELSDCFTCASGTKRLCHMETPTNDQTGVCCKEGVNAEKDYCTANNAIHCSDSYESAPYKWHAHCPGIHPETCGGHLNLVPIKVFDFDNSVLDLLPLLMMVVSIGSSIFYNSSYNS